MQERILRSDIDLHPIFDSEAFYRFQALSHFLIAPFVSRRNRKPEQVDDALCIKLCGHYTDLAVVENGVEVGVDDYFWRIGETRHGAEKQAKQKTTQNSGKLHTSY